MSVGRTMPTLAALGLLAACGAGSLTAAGIKSSSATPLTAAVQATPSLTFTPASVTIQRSGSVTIAFGSVAHTVFFDSGPAGAPANITGANANVSKSLTFSTVGTFIYSCHLHPGMQGTVVVVAPTP